MGWKLSSIIIHPAPAAISHEEILSKLGFSNFMKTENEVYDTAMYPEKDIYIGIYKNNLVIAVDILPIAFFDESLSDIEKKLIALFPGSEICAVSLHSTVNRFGFAVIKDGQKIRVKAGDGDIGTFIDFGTPLEQELELLSKSSMNQ